MEEPSETQKSKLFTMKLFVGIYLMSFTSAVPYIWGNINVYTMSYFKFRVNLDTESDSSWILALNALTWGMGIMAGSYFSEWFGFRVSMVASTIVFSTSMFLCFFAVQTSFVLLTVLLGIVCGFTFGLSQSLEIRLLTIWTNPKKLGLALCSVMVTQQIGLIVMSVILTRFVNPDSIGPDAKRPTVRMFSQSEILDKVPYMYVMYAVIAFGTGLLAWVLVWTSTPKRSKQQNDSKINIRRLFTKTNTEDSNKSENYKSTSHTPNLTVGYVGSDEQNSKELVQKSQNVDSSPSNFFLKQVLKTKNFYVLVMMGAYADVSTTVLNTYYKIFGLIYYPDDDFFTAMGLWMNVGVITACWLSGLACDHFSVKGTLVANTAILCLVSSVFYLSALVNKWLYLVLGVIYNGCTLAVYVMVSVSASAYFDKRHTTTVQGMALASLFFTCTVLPRVVSYILSTFGFFHLFTFVSVFILIGLIVVVLGLDYDTNKEDSKDKGKDAVSHCIE